MTTPHDARVPRSTSVLPALLAGGLLAGVLDAASAIHTYGWTMFYGIASGLLGSKAFPQAGGGGPAIWILGVALHFLIALSAAAVYSFVSRRLVSLKDHFILGGVICGVAVFLVMNLIVLPLSAVSFPIGPFTVAGLRMGLLFHVILVGLPISLSAWFFSRRERRRTGAMS
ncbi:MAG: hypothetical protein ABIZ04_25015 [Opitutus sp.]